LTKFCSSEKFFLWRLESQTSAKLLKLWFLKLCSHVRQKRLHFGSILKLNLVVISAVQVFYSYYILRFKGHRMFYWNIYICVRPKIQIWNSIGLQIWTVFIKHVNYPLKDKEQFTRLTKTVSFWSLVQFQILNLGGKYLYYKVFSFIISFVPILRSYCALQSLRNLLPSKIQNRNRIGQQNQTAFVAHVKWSQVWNLQIVKRIESRFLRSIEFLIFDAPLTVPSELP